MVTCLCCSLRVGIIIYSSICCICYIIKLGFICYYLYYAPSYYDHWQANILQSMLIIQMTISITCILNFGLLLLGAASKNENLLRPWLCFSFIILILIFCNAIFQLYDANLKMFTLSFLELMATGAVYSFVFCNFDELSNILSDEEDDADELEEEVEE